MILGCRQENSIVLVVPLKNRLRREQWLELAGTSLSIDDIIKLNFEDDVYVVPMIETMFSYIIDNCPGRSIGLFRSIAEME